MLTALALGTALCSAASSAARWAPAVGAVIWRSPRRRMSCLRTAGCVLQQTADCLTHGQTESCSPPRGWGGHGALVQALLNVGIMRPKGALLEQQSRPALCPAVGDECSPASLPAPVQEVRGAGGCAGGALFLLCLGGVLHIACSLAGDPE